MANLLNIKLEPTYDLYSIGFADMSHYDYPNQVIGSSIEIQPPGFPKKSLPFTIQVVNIYRSNDLGLNCNSDTLVPIPDGVYWVKYSIYPYDTNYVEKSFYRIDNLVCQFEEKFLSVELDGCDCNNNKKNLYKKKLADIRLLLETLIAASNRCDFGKADDIYNYIQNMLQTIKNCDCY